MPDAGLGSLLLIEVVDGTWSGALGRLLERIKAAGLLFRQLTNPEATLKACRESARVLGEMPFTAIEEEGGGPLAVVFKAIPRALSLSAQGAGEAGALIGRAMAALGLNLTLAPTLDLEAPHASARAAEIPSGAGNPESSPSGTASRAQAFVRALSSNHVLGCGRHFPGLPAERAKPIVVDRSLAALWRHDLVPYRTLGDTLAAVEMSYAVHRAYDYEFLRPASLSPGVVEGLLRAKLRFEGMALADASLAAQAAGVSIDEAAIRALAAGCDLILVPGEARLVETVSQGLDRAAGSGRLPRDRVTQALARVKSARGRVRRPPKQVAAREFSRLERDFEDFAAKMDA
jgi:beta-N-acetylhexosaminidase